MELVLTILAALILFNWLQTGFLWDVLAVIWLLIVGIAVLAYVVFLFIIPLWHGNLEALFPPAILGPEIYVIYLIVKRDARKSLQQPPPQGP